MNLTENKQLGALGFCALSLPAVLFLPQGGWAVALLVSLGSALLLCFGSSIPREDQSLQVKILSIPLFLWNIAIVGKICTVISEINGVHSPLPGLLLLLVVGYGVKKQVLPSTAAVIAFFMAAIYGILFIFAVPNVEISSLKPAVGQNLSGMAYGFLPILLLYVYKKEKKKTVALWTSAGLILILGAAVITQGMGAQDFYTASKSVNILGTMERLEPLVAAASTAGAYCMIGLLLSVNQNIEKGIRKKESKYILEIEILIASGICILLPEAEEWIWSIGTTVCWGLIPILTQVMVFRKKV